MQGVFVVFLVTGPEHDGVEQAQEADDVEEQRIQELRLEDGLVAQLVKPIQQKGIARAVQKEDDEQYGPGEPRGCIKSRRACQHEQPQMTKCLEQSLPIAALIEDI